MTCYGKAERYKENYGILQLSNNLTDPRFIKISLVDIFIQVFTQKTWEINHCNSSNKPPLKFKNIFKNASLPMLFYNFIYCIFNATFYWNISFIETWTKDMVL